MNQRLRVSVDHLHEGVQVIDRDWRYVYLNHTAGIHGRQRPEDLVGRTMQECYPGIEQTPLFATLKQVMDSCEPQMLRNEFTYPSGETRWFELIIDPVPDGICVLSLDVTERRRLEVELHQAQRLEALGRLAGGIAHDFNNQLTAILGFTEIVLGQLADPDLRRDLDQVKAAAERSAALTRQLLAFSRRQPLKITPMDMNAVVTRVDGLLRHLVGADVTYEVDLHDAAAMINGDSQQLENVLINLALNARDAMPTGGRLTIGTAVKDVADEDTRQHPDMRSGRYAVLTVADTGHGMDDDTRARIFDPFFTTKEEGKGTGLGLSMAHAVVTQMNGFIWVYSEINHGTTFRLYFPTTSDPPVVRAEQRSEPDRAQPASVLVVEDDRAVRELIVVALSRKGYCVRAAATGAEAMRFLEEGRGPDLLITDVVLPDQRGTELVAAAARRGCRVLVMSGHTRVQLPGGGVPDRHPFLPKPFSVGELVDAVGTSLREHRVR